MRIVNQRNLVGAHCIHDKCRPVGQTEYHFAYMSVLWHSLRNEVGVQSNVCISTLLDAEYVCQMEFHDAAFLFDDYCHTLVPFNKLRGKLLPRKIPVGFPAIPLYHEKRQENEVLYFRNTCFLPPSNFESTLFTPPSTPGNPTYPGRPCP